MTEEQLAEYCAFHDFDADSSFQSEADSIIKYVSTKLGINTLQVEIDNPRDYIVSLEESVQEYTACVNLYQARSVMPYLLGGATTGNLSGKMPKATLEATKRMAQPFAAEGLVGGEFELFSGSIDLHFGQQVYDMRTLMSGSIPAGQEMEIREIFHFSPVASYRFFDTSSAINYLNNQMKFESYTPETIFYLLPIWEDILRAQELQLGAKIRRSTYTYNLVGNKLWVYPIPTEGKKLFFTYYLKPQNPDMSTLPDVVTSVADIPFGTLSYNRINSIGKQWIRRFTLSLCREILGYNRSKFASMPVPNGDVTLNGSELVNNAKSEQDSLREELKVFLEEMTYDKIAMREAEKARALNETLQYINFKIWAA